MHVQQERHLHGICQRYNCRRLVLGTHIFHIDQRSQFLSLFSLSSSFSDENFRYKPIVIAPAQCSMCRCLVLDTNIRGYKMSRCRNTNTRSWSSRHIFWKLFAQIEGLIFYQIEIGSLGRVPFSRTSLWNCILCFLWKFLDRKRSKSIEPSISEASF